MKKILFILFILLFAVPARVGAQESHPINQILSISPVIFDIKLKAGAKQNYEVRVKNLMNQPLGIRLSAEGFSAADEENSVSFGKDSRMLSWIKFSENEFILSEKETKTLTLELDNPANLKDGGYYAVIFFTPFYSRPVEPNSPTILSRVGALMLATKGEINYSNLKNKVLVQNTGIKLLNETGNIDLKLRVSNSYFTHFSAKPFLKLDPIIGGKKETIELESKRVLPGKARIWNNKLSTNISKGIYKSTVLVSVGNGEQISKSSYFIVFPYKLILYPAVLVGILALVYLGRRRIKKALKELTK